MAFTPMWHAGCFIRDAKYRCLSIIVIHVLPKSSPLSLLKSSSKALNIVDIKLIDLDGNIDDDFDDDSDDISNDDFDVDFDFMTL